MPLAATWMELETLTLSERSQKEKDKHHMISLISGIQYTAQMNLSTKNKIMDLEKRLAVAKGRGEQGVGWTGSSGLIDANCYIQNGQTMRACCITQGSMSERERQTPYDITYTWNLILGAKEPFHRKENHGFGEQICGCQGVGGRSGMDWESGINRCELFHLEQISNEILLYSTGNCYLVTCDRK